MTFRKCIILAWEYYDTLVVATNKSGKDLVMVCGTSWPKYNLMMEGAYIMRPV